MSKHTPGPWSVGPDLEIFYAPNGSPITRPLRLTSMDGRTEEDRANARLIAAAPAMLEVLKELADDIQYNYGYNTEYQRIMNIIQLVEG